MLVQFAWGALEEYKYNAFLDYRMYHTYNSNRTYCTKLVADLIGATELVPPTQYARMILDGVEKYGVVVGVAAGCSPEEAVKQHGMHTFLAMPLKPTSEDSSCLTPAARMPVK